MARISIDRMASKLREGRKRKYRVTSTVVVTAMNPRHAAHIAKGVYEIRGPESPQHFNVEEVGPLASWDIDLTKRLGQEGYAERTDSSMPVGF